MQLSLTGFFGLGCRLTKVRVQPPQRRRYAENRIAEARVGDRVQRLQVRSDKSLKRAQIARDAPPLDPPAPPPPPPPPPGVCGDTVMALINGRADGGEENVGNGNMYLTSSDYE